MTHGERSSHCLVDFAGEAIATLTISNAGTLNILNTPIIEDLTRRLETLRDRMDLRVLVLRGAGE